jgi:ABC-type glycerol-3-phosphate transport system permease component
MTQSQQFQSWFRLGAVYVVLIVFGFLILFPFLFMFFTAFKEPTDVFSSPPRLLPRVPVTTSVEGFEEPLPLYWIENSQGERRQYALAESGINVSIFAPPDNLAQEYEFPKNQAKAVGGFVNQEKVTLEGSEYPVWEIDVDGQTVRVIEVRRTAVGRFIDPQNPEDEVLANVRTTPPVERFQFRWQNFRDVLQLQTLDRSLTNTLLVTILVVAGQLVTSILGGYAFARLQFPGRDSLFLVYLGTIMVPFVMLIIPLYQLMVLIGWVDRIASLTLPWIFTAYGTFLMRQFFITIPKELEEAALMDGASRFRILWTLFVPISGPAIATLATFSFLYAWNSFFWPYVVINAGNVKNHVLTLSLMVLQGRAADSPNLVMAGATIAVALPMIVFILAQRFFVESVASTGLK